MHKTDSSVIEWYNGKTLYPENDWPHLNMILSLYGLSNVYKNGSTAYSTKKLDSGTLAEPFLAEPEGLYRTIV